MTITKKALTGAGLAATVAMALVGCGKAAPDPAAPAAGGAISCKEANTCKGKATCSGVAGGEKHTCKGANACAGNVREVTKAECDAIKGTVVAAK